ncbi:MAG: acyltransferase family protein [Sphingomonas sp.]
MAEAAKHERLDTLQAGRAFAALGVVLFHLNVAIFGKAKYFPEELFPPFRTGHIGVEYFFVLSGFLMTWLYAGRTGDSAAAGRFLYKRALRVYPPYWVALFAVIPVFFLVPGFGTGSETTPYYLIASIFLLPTPEMPILNVAWTLQFEMLFYLGFAALLAWPKLVRPIVAIWAMIAIARHFLPMPPFPLSFVTDPWILLFLYGVGAAWLVRRGASRPWLWLAAGTLVFVASAWADEFSEVSRNWVRNTGGLGAAMMMIGLVTAERAGLIRVPRWLVYFGDMSYALYLIHFTVLSATVKLMFKLGIATALPRPVVGLLLVAACILAAAAMHELVEKRLMRFRPKRSGPNLGVGEAADPARTP